MPKKQRTFLNSKRIGRVMMIYLIVFQADLGMPYLIYDFYRGCQHFIIDRTIISCYFPSDLFVSYPAINFQVFAYNRKPAKLLAGYL